MYHSEEMWNKSPGRISVEKVLLRGQKALEVSQKMNVCDAMGLLWHLQSSFTHLNMYIWVHRLKDRSQCLFSMGWAHPNRQDEGKALLYCLELRWFSTLEYHSNYCALKIILTCSNLRGSVQSLKSYVREKEQRPFLPVQGRDKDNVQVCVHILWEILQLMRKVQKRENRKMKSGLITLNLHWQGKIFKDQRQSKSWKPTPYVSDLSAWSRAILRWILHLLLTP